MQVHFNQIYPGKSGYPEEFRRQLRDLVETVVANYKEVKNLWKKSEHIYCTREIDYGYSEFSSDQIWELKILTQKAGKYMELLLNVLADAEVFLTYIRRWRYNL